MRLPFQYVRSGMSYSEFWSNRAAATFAEMSCSTPLGP